MEKPVAQKIKKMGNTLFPQIIDEFMNKKCRVPSSINSWKKPLLSKAQVIMDISFSHSKRHKIKLMAVIKVYLRADLSLKQFFIQ